MLPRHKRAFVLVLAKLNPSLTPRGQAKTLRVHKSEQIRDFWQASKSLGGQMGNFAKAKNYKEEHAVEFDNNTTSLATHGHLLYVSQVCLWTQLVCGGTSLSIPVDK